MAQGKTRFPKIKIMVSFLFKPFFIFAWTSVSSIIRTFEINCSFSEKSYAIMFLGNISINKIFSEYSVFYFSFQKLLNTSIFACGLFLNGNITVYNSMAYSKHYWFSQKNLCFKTSLRVLRIILKTQKEDHAIYITLQEI